MKRWVNAIIALSVTALVGGCAGDDQPGSVRPVVGLDDSVPVTWAVTLGEDTLGPVINGKVLLSGGHTLTAVDVATGEVRWSVPQPSATRATQVEPTERACRALDDARMLCGSAVLDVESGRRMWTRPDADRLVRSGPVVIAMDGTDAGPQRVTALSAGGWEVWRKLYSPPWSVNVADGGDVVVATRTHVVGPGASTTRVDAVVRASSSGRVVYRESGMPGPAGVQANVGGGFAVSRNDVPEGPQCHSGDGRLIAGADRCAAPSAATWDFGRVRLPVGQSAVGVAGDIVLADAIRTDKSHVYHAYSRRTGEELWTTPANGPISNGYGWVMDVQPGMFVVDEYVFALVPNPGARPQRWSLIRVH